MSHKNEELFNIAVEETQKYFDNLGFQECYNNILFYYARNEKRIPKRYRKILEEVLSRIDNDIFEMIKDKYGDIIVNYIAIEEYKKLEKEEARGNVLEAIKNKKKWLVGGALGALAIGSIGIVSKNISNEDEDIEDDGDDFEYETSESDEESEG